MSLARIRDALLSSAGSSGAPCGSGASGSSGAGSSSGFGFGAALKTSFFRPAASFAFFPAAAVSRKSSISCSESFGGASAYEAASKDPRIRAVVEGDGTIWQPAGLNIAVPLLFVQSGVGAQLSIFSQVNADGYAVLFDDGVTHLGIEDQSLWWRWDFPALNPFGPRGGEDALRSIGLVSGEFLRKYLDGVPAPSLDDPLQTPDGVRIRIF